MKLKEFIQIKELFKQFKGQEDKSDKVINTLLKVMPEKPLKQAQKDVLKYLDILNKDYGSIKLRFTLDKVEYGLIPNFEKMTTEEFLFLEKFQNDDNNIHKLMAVLYRPIKESRGKYYTIEDFNKDKINWEAMLETDVSIWLSVKGFFLDIWEIPTINFLKYGEEKNKQQKEKRY